MLHQLRRAAPEVDFRAVNDRASCKYMKMITPAALLRCLRRGRATRSHVDPEIAARGARQRAADDRDRHSPAAANDAGLGGRQADVVVVGTGVAGLAAALAPQRPGCRVVVLSKARPTPADALGAGRHRGRRCADVPRTRSTAHVADTLAAGAGLCDPTRCASIVRRRLPAAVAALVERGARVRRGRGRRVAAHPRGRALARPHHPRRRRRHRAPRSSGRSMRAAAGLPLLDRARRARRAARPTAAVAGVAVLDDDGRPGVLHAPAVLLATGGLGQLFAATTNPATVDRRRRGAGAAGRRGGRPTSSSCSSTRPCCTTGPATRAAAADHRGGPRRGRGAARRRGRPVHGRRAPAGRPGAARRGRRGDHPADGARPAIRLRLPRRPRHRRLRRAASRRSRGLPGGRASTRRANRSRWRPAAHYALRRRGHRRRRAHRRCPACTPRARWRAPACTAPTGWRPTACWRAWCVGERVARAVAVESRARPRHRQPRTAAGGTRARCADRGRAAVVQRAMTAAAGIGRDAAGPRRGVGRGGGGDRARGAGATGPGSRTPRSPCSPGRARRGGHAHREPRLPRAHRLPGRATTLWQRASTAGAAATPTGARWSLTARRRAG